VHTCSVEGPGIATEDFFPITSRVDDPAVNCEGAGRQLSIPAKAGLFWLGGVARACWDSANQRLCALAGKFDGRFATETNRRASPKKQKAPSLQLEDLLNSIGALPPI
jgi:hypothetical protein